MNQRTMIALGVAVVLGLIAVFLANSYLNATERKNDSEAMSRVAVAAVPLDYGVELTPDKVKFVNYPVASLPAGAFREWNQLAPEGKSRFVIRPMSINEPILAAKLAGEGQGASIAYLLPDGMRAAAVRINDVSGVAGFIQPSDAVDVLITRQLQAGGANRQVTDVLLQNVRVIAIDQNAQGENAQPVVAQTATLEVTPTDAQKLALAQQVGQLSLVLRKPGLEQDVGAIQTVSLEDLRYSRTAAAGGAGNSYSANPVGYTVPTRQRTARTPVRRTTVKRSATPAAPQRPSTTSVEVVRGTEGSNYEVGGYGS